MNILQIEDRLKSVPDDNLQNEMTNPSGMFPQYLVMSEIQRRAKMRDDYEGRMAAESKTPPLPSIREQMVMEVSQQPQTGGGIANLLPETQTQAMPQSPAMLQQPVPMPQEPVRMNNGGVLKMRYGGEFDPFEMYSSIYGFRKQEDDPSTPDIDESTGLPIFEKTKYQKDLEEYYKELATLNKEKIAKQRKLQGGLGLLQAGIAVGTSAKPEELGANLNRLIDSIGRSEAEIQKIEDKAAKDQIQGIATSAAMEQKQKEGFIKALEAQEDRDIKRLTAEAYKKQIEGTPDKIIKRAKEMLGLEGVDFSTTLTEEEYKSKPRQDVYTMGYDENQNPVYYVDIKKTLNEASELEGSVQSRLVAEIGDILGSEEKTDIFLSVQLRQQINPKTGKPYTVVEANEYIKQADAKEKEAKALELLTLYGQRKATGGVIKNTTDSFYDAIETLNG